MTKPTNPHREGIAGEDEYHSYNKQRSKCRWVSYLQRSYGLQERFVNFFLQQLGPRPNRTAGVGKTVAPLQLHAFSVGVHRLRRVKTCLTEGSVVHKKKQLEVEVQISWRCKGDKHNLRRGTHRRLGRVLYVTRSQIDPKM